MRFEHVPAKGTVTKFRERMGADFNRFFGDLIAYITDCMDFADLERYQVILFTKCYFGNRDFPRTSKAMEITGKRIKRIYIDRGYYFTMRRTSAGWIRKG